MTPVFYRDPTTRKLARVHVDDCADPELARQLVAETLPAGHAPIMALVAPQQAQATEPQLA